MRSPGWLRAVLLAGVTITADQVKTTVAKHIADNKARLVEDR